jgi:hypothetical protein
MTIICDVIKIADRLSKDGRVISFAFHHADDIADVVNAPTGSQWQMKLVPLDEHGNPERAVPAGQFAGGDIASDRVEIPLSGGKCNAGTGSAGADGSNPSRSTKISPEKRLTRQAAIVCTEPLFHAWLRETNSAWRIMNHGTDEDKAAAIVRARCNVKSRKEIVPGSTAADLWDEMYSKYTAWKLVAA